MKKGGLARRAGFLTQSRADTVLNLTVDAGNFAPATAAPGDSIKTLAFVEFYRRYGYDAVGLSNREIARGLSLWRKAAAEGLPVVAANVFQNAHSLKPVFQPYVIRKEQGRKLGVIGFVSASAWKAKRDTAAVERWESPFAMGKLVHKVAKKSDWLTVIGEFTLHEADSLVKAFPEIDLVVTSGVRTDQPTRAGHSLIIGTQAKGSFANFLDLTRAPTDSLEYSNRSQVLDESVPIDSSEVQMLTETNNRVKALSAVTH